MTGRHVKLRFLKSDVHMIDLYIYEHELLANLRMYLKKLVSLNVLRIFPLKLEIIGKPHVLFLSQRTAICTHKQKRSNLSSVMTALGEVKKEILFLAECEVFPPMPTAGKLLWGTG